MIDKTMPFSLKDERENEIMYVDKVEGELLSTDDIEEE